VKEKEEGGGLKQQAVAGATEVLLAESLSPKKGEKRGAPRAPRRSGEMAHTPYSLDQEKRKRDKNVERGRIAQES